MSLLKEYGGKAFQDFGPFEVDGITYRRTKGSGPIVERLMFDVLPDYYDDEEEDAEGFVHDAAWNQPWRAYANGVMWRGLHADAPEIFIEWDPTITF